jgi:hypothetical protein
MGSPRRITRIAAATEQNGDEVQVAVLFVLADDGTCGNYSDRTWVQLPALPDAETCGVRDRNAVGPMTACRLAKAHRDQHWNGSRRWG